uniref:Putative secreted protein n=1 Tax=Anopheles marajoara TaxID=58244 RepID=A0A2M4C5V5_9DIPT
MWPSFGLRYRCIRSGRRWFLLRLLLLSCQWCQLIAPPHRHIITNAFHPIAGKILHDVQQNSFRFQRIDLVQDEKAGQMGVFFQHAQQHRIERVARPGVRHIVHHSDQAAVLDRVPARGHELCIELMLLDFPATNETGRIEEYGLRVRAAVDGFRYPPGRVYFRRYRTNPLIDQPVDKSAFARIWHSNHGHLDEFLFAARRRCWLIYGFRFRMVVTVVRGVCGCQTPLGWQEIGGTNTNPPQQPNCHL